MSLNTIENVKQVNTDQATSESTLSVDQLLKLMMHPLSDEEKAKMQSYGDYVKQVRHKYKISYERLVQLLETEHTVLIALERGYGDLTQAQTIIKKLQILELSWTHLCGC